MNIKNKYSRLFSRTIALIAAFSIIQGEIVAIPLAYAQEEQIIEEQETREELQDTQDFEEEEEEDEEVSEDETTEGSEETSVEEKEGENEDTVEEGEIEIEEEAEVGGEEEDQSEQGNESESENKEVSEENTEDTVNDEEDESEKKENGDDEILEDKTIGDSEEEEVGDEKDGEDESEKNDQSANDEDESEENGEEEEEETDAVSEGNDQSANDEDESEENGEEEDGDDKVSEKTSEEEVESDEETQEDFLGIEGLSGELRILDENKFAFVLTERDVPEHREGQAINQTEVLETLTKALTTSEEVLAEKEADEDKNFITKTFTSDVSDLSEVVTDDPEEIIEEVVAEIVEENQEFTNFFSVQITPKAGGETITLDPAEEYSFVSGSVVLVLEPNLVLDPGTYIITVEVVNPITGETEIITQDLNWGVLAMNTNQDTYLANDTATIDFGMIDETGAVVCDGALDLDITKPDGSTTTLSTASGDIVVSETCGELTNDIPADYTTTYAFTQEGTYTLALDAVNANGAYSDVTFGRLEKTVVVGAASFDAVISRNMNTRLFPGKDADVSITLDFSTDFAGGIYDVAPLEFELKNIGQGGVEDISESGEHKVIVWNVTASAGESITLSYTYNAPDVSPYFYTVGPLQSADGSIVEAQVWQIANDALPAPGAVDTNLELWLKADAGVEEAASDPAEDADAVLNWLDQSGNNNDVTQATTANKPAYAASTINFNPGVDFDGVNDILKGSSALLANTPGFDVYMVTQTDATQTQNYGRAFYAGGTVSNGRINLILGVNNANPRIMRTLGHQGATNIINVENVSAVGIPTLYEGRLDDANNDRLLIVNGTEHDNDAFTTNTNNGTDNFMSLGAEIGEPTFSYEGMITEIIVYNQDNATAADRQKIQSYLALKYGITLDQGTAQDYLASDGTDKIWDKDATGASTYDNDIVGVGRDDDSALGQVQSKSVNDDAIVEVLAESEGTNAANSFVDIADLEFLTFGNDDGAATWTATGAPTDYEILTRQWSVQETGDVGTVQLDIDVADADFDLPSVLDDYYFIYDADNDGDLSDETPVVMTDQGGNIWRITGINFDSGEEFTLARAEPLSPGGVASNLQLWFKADAGVTGTTAVTAWTDQSGAGYDATATQGPELSTNSINFNPALDFVSAGSEYLQIINGILGTSTHNDAWVYTVSKTDLDQQQNIFFENVSGTSEYFNLITPWNNEQTYFDFGNITVAGRIQVLWGSNYGDYNMWTYGTSDGTATPNSTRKVIQRDGAVIASNNNNDNATGNNSNFNIGGGYSDGVGTTNSFDGKIAEMIVYLGVPSALEQEKVQSYLGVKYGITKNSADNGGTGGEDERDYFASDGTVIWDYSANSTYHNDVTGVGRDDDSGLGQVESRSINADSIIHITADGEGTNAANSFVDIADLEFLTFGNDDGSTSVASSEVPSGIDERLAREWLAQETGDVGNITIAFDLDDQTALTNTGTASDYRLLVDADGDFSNATISSATVAFVGNEITFSGVSELDDGEYFTVSMVNSAPTDLQIDGGNTDSIDENTSSGTTVGTLTTTDADGGDTHTYTFVAGTGDEDNAKFTIGGAGSDEVKLAFLPDFETPVDANTDNTYNLRIETSDGAQTYAEAITITINDLNVAPTNIDIDGGNTDSQSEGTAANTVISAITSTDDGEDNTESYTYSLTCTVAGVDDAHFNILGTDLRNTTVFDFLVPVDDNTDNDYEICLRVTETNGGLTYDENFTITVTDTNSAPTDIQIDGGNTDSIDENTSSGTTVGTLTTTDADGGDTHTYTFVAGTGDEDNALFTIGGAGSDEVKLAFVPDFETPVDDNTDNTYNLRIQTDDGNGGTYVEAITVTVNDLNTAPTNIDIDGGNTDSQSEGTAANTVISAITSTDDGEDNTESYTYSLTCTVAGVDDAHFNILGTDLRNTTVFDFLIPVDDNTDNDYEICLRVTETNGGLTYDENFTITVTDTNSAPTDIQIDGGNTDSIDENTSSGTTVGTLTTTDADGGDTHTYTFVAGTGDEDNAKFTIGGAGSDEVKLAFVPDFETPVDDNTDNTYNLRIQTDDGNGGTYVEAITVTVNDLNTAPTNIDIDGGNTDSQSEGTAANTVISAITSTDDGEDNTESYTYSLTCTVAGVDDAHFNILGTDLRNTTVFDFLIPVDDNTDNDYEICLRVTETNGGLTYDENFTITVTDTNSAPTDIQIDGGNTDSIDENTSSGTTVGTLTTTDADGGDTHTYTFVAGTGDEDNAKFTIGGAGSDEVKLAFVPDFETPVDDNTDNTYNLRIQTDDGNGGTYVEAITVTVNDLNTAPTNIDIDGGNTDSQSEGTAANTVISAITSTDDGEDNTESYTYSLTCTVAGVDDAHFNILGTDLRNTTVFDFLIPVDDNTDNDYEICLRVTETNGGLTYDENFTITVTDTNSAPTDIQIDGGNTDSIDENTSSGTTVGTLTTTDADGGDTHTYTFVAGTGDEDNAKFTIGGAGSDEVKLAFVPDFETPVDDNTDNTYNLRIQTDDGNGGTYVEAITVTVNDLNTAPTNIDIDGGNTDSQSEGTAANTVISAITSTDDGEDNTESYTYSLTCTVAGVDDAHFNILGTDLRNTTVFDFLVPVDDNTDNDYEICLRVTETNGGLTYDENFTITVTDTNSAPTDIQIDGGNTDSIDENTSSGTTVGTLTTTDADGGDTHTYTFVAGTGDEDNALFTIGGAGSDEVKLAFVPDFETPVDDNTDNTYNLRIQTDDGNGGTYVEAITVTVNDLNTAPTNIDIDGGNTDSQSEGTAANTVISAITSTDDGEDNTESYTYSLTCTVAGVDDAHFNILGTDLRNTTVFDFLIPVDDNTDNDYEICLRVTETNGGLTYDENFTITVTDTNSAPTDIQIDGGNTDSIDENTSSGTTVGTLTTTDADGGDTHTYTFVAGTGDEDNALFTIGGAGSDEVKLAFVPDFETPVDDNTDNTYNLRIQTDDGNGGTYVEAITVTVNDLNTAPTNIDIDGGNTDSQSEGTAANTVISAITSTDDGEDNTESYTYSLTCTVAGVDDAHFNILGTDLRNTTVFDFLIPVDDNTDNDYEICLRVTETNGGLTYDENFTITVTDTNSAPTDIQIDGGNTDSIDENTSSGTTVGTLTTTDADGGDTHTYTFVAGTGDEDNALFTIGGAGSDEVKLAFVPDFETPVDDNTDNTYNLRIQTDDGNGGTYVEAITVTVNDLNTAPTNIDIDGGNTDSQSEGTAANTVISAITSTDDGEDNTESYTYSLTCTVAGVDDAHFNILGTDLRNTTVFDFLIPVDDNTDNDYEICLRVTETNGGLTYDENFTITVTDTNSAPTDIQIDGGNTDSIDENTSSGTTVGTLTTTDADGGDTHTYTFVAGTGDEDNALFTIGGAGSDEVKLAFVPDFETPVDDNTDNTYNLRIQTDDGNGGTYVEAITVTVNDLNTAPTNIDIDGGNTDSQSEGTAANTVISAITSTDDGEDNTESYTYSLTCTVAGVDDAHFNILGTDLRNTTVFDFLIPVDDNTDNDYEICLRVTETNGGLTYDENLTVGINSLGDTVAPRGSGSNRRIRESFARKEEELRTSASEEDTSEEDSCTTKFRDTQEHWGERYITKLECLDIVHGRSNNLEIFEPDDEIMRAELAKIAVLIAGYSPDLNAVDAFPDVRKDHWGLPYISVAREKGILRGYKDGYFRPSQFVTRAEALKMLLLAGGFDLGSLRKRISQFRDVEDFAWYRDIIDFGIEKGIIEGYSSKVFKPNEYITRTEAARMAVLVLEFMEANQ